MLTHTTGVSSPNREQQTIIIMNENRHITLSIFIMMLNITMAENMLHTAKY